MRKGEIISGHVEQNPAYVKLDLTFKTESINSREICPKLGAIGKNINSVSRIIVIELEFFPLALYWSLKP